MTPSYDPPTAPLVYLAEAIDRASGPSRTGYSLAHGLAAQGCAVYRPAGAWSGGNHHPALVEHFNRQLLREADVLVADFTSGVGSIGMPCEIEAHTARSRTAVVLWQHGVPRSVALQANSHVLWAATVNEAVELAADLAHIRWKARQELGVWGEPKLDELRLQTAAGAPEPQRAYPDDAGIDLVTAVDTEIPPGRFVDVPTTIIGVQPPANSWLLITGRSSTLRKHGLHVPVAVIDAGWRGPLFAGVWNLGAETVHVKAGDRLAQVIAIHNKTAELAIVAGDSIRLDPHDRGLNGFGSTGQGGAPLTPDDMVVTEEDRTAAYLEMYPDDAPAPLRITVEQGVGIVLNGQPVDAA